MLRLSTYPAYQPHPCAHLHVYVCLTTEASSAPEANTVPRADEWQLDFCSRPILDERGKKLWELLICDERRDFEFSRFFSNNQINSTQVQPPARLGRALLERRSCTCSPVSSCNPDGSNNVSHLWCLQLKNALSELMNQPGAQRPKRVKFFRGQMQTIITRAVADLDIKPIPSRRCFTLLSEC